MNKCFKIFAGIAAVMALASCNKEVEYQTSSFVTFESTGYTVQENAGTVKIPLHAYAENVDLSFPREGANTSVTFQVIDNTAKNGVNFTVEPANGVLDINGTTDSAITLNITNLVGEFTGDLTFTIAITGASNDYTIGGLNTVNVTIKDIDHPLADVLGNYTVTQEDFAQGPVSYTMQIVADDKDLSVVWIYPICPLASQVGFQVYGTVSEDHKTITIPCGQELDGLIFGEYTFDNGHYFDDGGEIVMTSTTPGVFTTEQGIGIVEGNSLYGGGVIIQGTTKWTKQ